MKSKNSSLKRTKAEEETNVEVALALRPCCELGSLNSERTQLIKNRSRARMPRLDQQIPTWHFVKRLSAQMVENARIIIDRVVSKYTLAYARATAWGENRRDRLIQLRKSAMIAQNPLPKLRVFELLRDEDPSGVSGVGRVAVGVVFPSGKVVLEWLGSHSTLGIYDDLKRVEYIHGHGGKTRIVFTRGAKPFRVLTTTEAVTASK